MYTHAYIMNKGASKITIYHIVLRTYVRKNFWEWAWPL